MVPFCIDQHAETSLLYEYSFWNHCSRALTKLIQARPSAELFPIIVSQVCCAGCLPSVQLCRCMPSVHLFFWGGGQQLASRAQPGLRKSSPVQMCLMCFDGMMHAIAMAGLRG